MASQNAWFVKGFPTDFVMSLSYFSHVPEVRKFLSNLLFNVEFADKKNCTFSSFIFSKFMEQYKYSQLSVKYGLISLYIPGALSRGWGCFSFQRSKRGGHGADWPQSWVIRTRMASVYLSCLSDSRQEASVVAVALAVTPLLEMLMSVVQWLAAPMTLLPQTAMYVMFWFPSYF